ncbi:MAG: outer membrane beta-barrel protein [Candidatus Eisenbacteria bacterium]
MKSERRSGAARRRVLGTGLLAAVLLFAPAGAGADTKGFMLGLDLHYSGIGAEEESATSHENSVFVDEDGGGATLLLGYGFTEAFALRVSMNASNHETSDSDVDVLYANSTIEAMYVFRHGWPFRPYLFGGIGGCSLESRYDPFRYETSGPGTAAGAGFLYFPGEHFAIDVALRFEFINWDKATAELVTDQGTLTVETPIEDEGSAVKVLFGVNYWF